MHFINEREISYANALDYDYQCVMVSVFVSLFNSCFCFGFFVQRRFFSASAILQRLALFNSNSTVSIKEAHTTQHDHLRLTALS